MDQPTPPKSIADHDKTAQQHPEPRLVAEPRLKPEDKAENTLTVNRGAIRVPSPDPSLVSIDDSNNVRIGRTPDRSSIPFYHARQLSRSPSPPRSFKGRIQASWTANKGLALVLISQLFGTLMNVTTRMLEMEGNNGKLVFSEVKFLLLADCNIGNGYDPFQILFARMSITVILSSLYMWYRKTEHFPFGMKEVRPLLIARGLTGFFGVFGMYCK